MDAKSLVKGVLVLVLILGFLVPLLVYVLTPSLEMQEPVMDGPGVSIQPGEEGL